VAAILMIGGLGFAGQNLPGRSVGEQEKAAVLGSACYSKNAAVWMCYGGGNGGSDCTGCGCTWAGPPYSDPNGVYNTATANCASDPHCTTVFASGNCSTH
jgi:hypothetical protein